MFRRVRLLGSWFKREAAVVEVEGEEEEEEENEGEDSHIDYAENEQWRDNQMMTEPEKRRRACSVGIVFIQLRIDRAQTA